MRAGAVKVIIQCVNSDFNTVVFPWSQLSIAMLSMFIVTNPKSIATSKICIQSGTQSVIQVNMYESGSQ